MLFYFILLQLQAWKGSTPINIVQRVADHDGSVIIQRGTLSGLEKFTQYTVGIVAYNGAGDSPRSDTKIIKTEEGGTCFPELLIRIFIERFLSADTITFT